MKIYKYLWVDNNGKFSMDSKIVKNDNLIDLFFKKSAHRINNDTKCDFSMN